MTATVATLGMLPAAHPYRGRAATCSAGIATVVVGGLASRHGPDFVRAALDVPRHRALGRAAPRSRHGGANDDSRCARGCGCSPRAMAALPAVPWARISSGPTPPDSCGLRQRIRCRRRPLRAEAPGGNAQHFVAGMDIPGQWWTLFQSPKLNQLVEQALKANPDVGAAQAALRQAHELYLAQRTSFFPTVQGNFSGDSLQESPSARSPIPRTCRRRTRTTTSTPPSSAELHAGCLRRHPARGRSGEGAGRQHSLPARSHLPDLEQQRRRHRVQEASLRGQIAATERLLELQHQLTDKVQQQRALGTASDLDVLAQQAAGGANRRRRCRRCRSNWGRRATP